MLIKCPECGHQVSDQAKTCPSCGIDIAGKITRCPDCGEVIFKEQSFCPNCHCSINGASTTGVDLVESSSVRDVLPVARHSAEKALQEEARQQPDSAPRRSRKKKAGMAALIIGFVIALIAVFLLIYFMKNQERQVEQRAYENAIKSTEPLVLQNFLDMYGDAPKVHRDSIQLLLNGLKKIENDWHDAMVNNSKTAFERFVKLHPQSGHVVEAGIKIDSLDWIAAKNENTSDAFKKYMEDHEDGAYYDEAHASYEQLEAEKVKPEDRLVVSQLFTTFFNALAQMDESAMASTIAPVLTSFLHRPNATKADVRQYMEKLHEADVSKIEFAPNGDWAIEKVKLGEGQYGYNVNFTVAQHTVRGFDNEQSSTVYKVTAQVSPEGRITELNMKRSVQ